MKPVFSADNIDIYALPVAEGPESRHEREREAVSNIVQAVFGTEYEVSHREDGSPYIGNIEATISVSHSRRSAVVAVDRRGRPVGIDIEEARQQLRRVAPRVFSEAEIEVYGSEVEGLATAWTLKEAAYKCAGIRGLDFRRDIFLTPASNRLVAGGKTLEIAFSGPFEGQFLSLVYEK